MPAYVDSAGHLAVLDRSAFRAELMAKFADSPVVVTVQPKTVYRSLRASNYYWAVVVQAAVDHTGQDPDTIHAFWCEQFLPSERKQLLFFNALTGQSMRAHVETRRSSKLTGGPFYDFVENCRGWLTEWLGVSTPDPQKDFWRTRKEREAVPQ